MSQRSASLIIPAVVITCTCGWVGGAIRGSKHDFTGAPWNMEDSCAVCHTPQRPEPPTVPPLWEPGADINRRFGLRRSQASPGSGTTTCLRCHDGTVARETVAAVPASRSINVLSPAMFSAAHGGTDHPVGVEYPAINKGYRPVSAVQARGAVSLPNGMVECVSCHDPHDVAGIEHMLVMQNTRSALCLTCHNK